MAYCRFSDMNFKCDLYIYENIYGGITVHVKSRRIIGEVPPLPRWDDPDAGEKIKKWSEFFDNVKYEPIGLPYDGETFYEDLSTIIPRVEMLINEGYRAPKTLLKDIADDIQER